MAWSLIIILITLPFFLYIKDNTIWIQDKEIIIIMSAIPVGNSECKQPFFNNTFFLNVFSQLLVTINKHSEVKHRRKWIKTINRPRKLNYPMSIPAIVLCPLITSLQNTNRQWQTWFGRSNCEYLHVRTSEEICTNQPTRAASVAIQTWSRYALLVPYKTQDTFVGPWRTSHRCSLPFCTYLSPYFTLFCFTREKKFRHSHW